MLKQCQNSQQKPGLRWLWRSAAATVPQLLRHPPTVFIPPSRLSKSAPQAPSKILHTTHARLGAGPRSASTHGWFGSRDDRCTNTAAEREASLRSFTFQGYEALQRGHISSWGCRDPRFCEKVADVVDQGHTVWGGHVCGEREWRPAGVLLWSIRWTWRQ